MSEFDRSENLRRSIRRPRKQAPLPPNSNVNSKNEDCQQADLKKMLISKRDFVAPTPLPRVPVVQAESNFDESHNVLKQIQTQINQLEFNAAMKPEKIQTAKPITRTRYDAMVSVLNTGISDLKTNEHDDDEDDDIDGNTQGQFYRGGATRSSVQATRDQQSYKLSRPTAQVQRTASDSKKVEMLRKHIKQRELIINKKLDEEKVKRFEIYKKRCKYPFQVS